MKDYPIKTPRQLGAILQGYRQVQKLTQKDVGTKVGLAQNVVSLLEAAPERASFGRICKLLSALDLELVVRTRGTTPTTHILKLPLGVSPQGIALSSSVENEWLCSEVVRSYGIDVARSWVETFGEYKVLVVERFDRRPASGGKWYLRLPQEDFCQATATLPGLKYESDGGPGIAKVMNLLLGSEQSEMDRRDFMRPQVVFWLLAAIDGHAKNFSVFLLPAGAYKLTPRYDILSAYPVLGHGRGKLAREKIKMAMAVQGKNRHFRWQEIHGRHWIETAKRCGFSEMKSVLEDVIVRTPKAIEHARGIIPARFPGQIADAILSGIKARAEQLKAELSA